MNAKLRSLNAPLRRALKFSHDHASQAVEGFITTGKILSEAEQTAETKEEFHQWAEQHGLKYAQITRYKRIAHHEHQARQLVGGVKDICAQLPKLSEPPAPPPEDEKDSRQLGYVGTKPGSNSRDQWYTPAVYIESARRVMGSIDFDPFSNFDANKTVRAGIYYDEGVDAFSTEWHAVHTVWMNPPYSRGNSDAAVDAFLAAKESCKFSRAVVLMNNSTDSCWWHKLISEADAVCFTKGRIAFEKKDGKKASGNTRGQCFFYFGENAREFADEFSSYGTVVFTQNMVGVEGL